MQKKNNTNNNIDISNHLEDGLDKLERRRAFARAMAKKYYECNKDKVLEKRKAVRKKLNKKVSKTISTKNILFYFSSYPTAATRPPSPQTNIVERIHKVDTDEDENSDNDAYFGSFQNQDKKCKQTDDEVIASFQRDLQKIEEEFYRLQKPFCK